MYNAVLTCAFDQGFGGATLAGLTGLAGDVFVPTLLLFGPAEVAFNAQSVVLTFAKKNGFPFALYVTDSHGAIYGITLPTPPTAPNP